MYALAIVLVIVIIIIYFVYSTNPTQSQSSFSGNNNDPEMREYLEEEMEDNVRIEKHIQRGKLPMSEPDHFEDVGSETYADGYKPLKMGPVQTMQPMRKFIASLKK